MAALTRIEVASSILAQPTIQAGASGASAWVSNVANPCGASKVHRTLLSAATLLLSAYSDIVVSFATSSSFQERSKTVSLNFDKSYTPEMVSFQASSSSFASTIGGLVMDDNLSF
jgi:hypothetical protein